MSYLKIFKLNFNCERRFTIDDYIHEELPLYLPPKKLHLYIHANLPCSQNSSFLSKVFILSVSFTVIDIKHMYTHNMYIIYIVFSIKRGCSHSKIPSDV